MRRRWPHDCVDGCARALGKHLVHAWRRGEQGRHMRAQPTSASISRSLKDRFDVAIRPGVPAGQAEGHCDDHVARIKGRRGADDLLEKRPRSAGGTLHRRADDVARTRAELVGEGIGELRAHRIHSWRGRAVIDEYHLGGGRVHEGARRTGVRVSTLVGGWLP